MILPFYDKFKIGKFLEYAIYILGFISAAVLIISLSIIFQLKEKASTIPTSVLSSISSMKNYEAITKGILALYPGSRSCFYPDLKQEILLLALNTRPDIPLHERQVSLALKRSKQEQIIKSGQSLYLNHHLLEDGSEESFLFSSEKTPLWIKPLLVEGDGVLIEAGKEIVSEKGEIIYETMQFILKEEDFYRLNSNYLNGSKEEPDFFNCLKQAKWWGPDIFIQSYGGKGYQGFKTKHKIEFFDARGSYICFVSAQDFLTWKDGRWKVTYLDEVLRQAPIAQVLSINNYRVEIMAWDQKGFSPKIFNLESQPLSKLSPKMEILPTALRLRSSSQVTCLFGKRRLILKQGDWLLKTASGWRNLKRVQEIEDCLDHSLRGELFIFDELHKEQDKIFLKGHLFNEMRTQSQSVFLPVQENRKSARPKKKGAVEGNKSR